MSDRFVDQTIFLNDPDGRRGNCSQAVAASWFGQALDFAPDFANDVPDHLFYSLFYGWWLERGFILEMTAANGHPLPLERCLVVGKTARSGELHVCIYEGGELLHDPHPDKSGLTSVRFAWVPRELGELRAYEKSYRDLRALLAQRERELEALRGKVRAVVDELGDRPENDEMGYSLCCGKYTGGHTAACPWAALLAALSDNPESPALTDKEA